MRSHIALRSGAGAVTLLVCVVLVRVCSLTVPCITTVSHPDLWLVWLLGPVALILLGSALLAAGRTLWLLRETSQAMRRLQRVLPPGNLEAALRRTGVRAVECLDSDVPLAFCAGVRRPAILVTVGLVVLLRPDELDAVLLHERHHRARRDPLRYAMRRAVADVCFYLPLASWWVHHEIERAELSADRAAIRHTGPRPLAGALWVVGDHQMGVPGMPAFQGVVQLRAAQLLGDPLPMRRPTRSLWLASGVGLAAAYGLGACMMQVMLALS